MTKTARDLRSAAHALRTAANALEETVTALRALSDDLNEPDPEPGPTTAWPTAPQIAAAALREAVEAWRRGHTFSVMEDWLHARADQIEREARTEAALIDAVDRLAQASAQTAPTCFPAGRENGVSDE